MFKLLPQEVQLAVAFTLSLMGVALLVIGLLLPPVGIINSSVLVAVGETYTFAGAIFGIDYTYRYNIKK